MQEEIYLAPSRANMVWVSKPRLMYINLFGEEQAYKMVNAKGTYMKNKILNINEPFQVEAA